MLELVRARLADHGAPITTVVIAEDIDEMANEAGRVPNGAVVITPLRERGLANALVSGGFRQRVEVQLLVGFVIRQHGLLGAARALSFDAGKNAIETALAGWEPPGLEPFELVGGESSPLGAGVSIYVQTWQTARFLTGA